MRGRTRVLRLIARGLDSWRPINMKAALRALRLEIEELERQVQHAQNGDAIAHERLAVTVFTIAIAACQVVALTEQRAPGFLAKLDGAFDMVRDDDAATDRLNGADK